MNVFLCRVRALCAGDLVYRSPYFLGDLSECGVRQKGAEIATTGRMLFIVMGSVTSLAIKSENSV